MLYNNTMRGEYYVKKRSVYLDTSIISYLDAKDTPEKMEATLHLWSILKTDKYDVFVSSVVFEEINKCSEPKRSFMIEMLNKINYIELEPSSNIADLVIEYLENRVLKAKSINDLMHIAYAVANDIDYIVSWNFKHFVNVNTIQMVNSVNMELGYDMIQIIPPVMLEGEENEGK